MSKPFTPEISAEQLKDSIGKAPSFRIEHVPPEACCLCGSTSQTHRVTLLHDNEDPDGYMVFPVCIPCTERYRLFVFPIGKGVDDMDDDD